MREANRKAAEACAPNRPPVLVDVRYALCRLRYFTKRIANVTRDSPSERDDFFVVVNKVVGENLFRLRRHILKKGARSSDCCGLDVEEGHGRVIRRVNGVHSIPDGHGPSWWRATTPSLLPKPHGGFVGRKPGAMGLDRRKDRIGSICRNFGRRRPGLDPAHAPGRVIDRGAQGAT
jgi:hypothetical protein